MRADSGARRETNFMQDVQNIPNPDVNSYESEDDFNTHSENGDIEKPEESIPTPPDRAPGAPVEEPPAARRSPIDEGTDAPPQIV